MAVINRRGFLTGGIAATPLIGTALAAGPFQAKNVPALRGSRNSVVVPTHELAGNLSERLDFPAAWQVNVLEMAGYQAGALTPQQVAARLNQPIGTKTVRELAQGKKTAVITFDDMTRVTPVQAVAPWILGELKAAGLADENILFLTSFGTHRPMNAVEIATKLGKDIPRRYAWLNHDCFDNLKDVGETSRGNKIRLNQSFVGADLRICISGIKIHASAGYGGGAKAILPGVAGISTIEYNHEKIMRNTKTAGPFKVFKNEMRLDMIEAARFAKVDYTVQALFNQRLQPTHIYAGDIVDAHHEAVRTAVKHYATKPAPGSDIVVVNAYPQCTQANNSSVLIGPSIKDGGTGVLIVQHPLGIDPVHYLNNRMSGLKGDTYFDLTAKRLNARTPKYQLIVYSQYTDRTQMNNYPKGTLFLDKWADVVKTLQERHKGDSVKVAVYPYGGIQHEEGALDG